MESHRQPRVPETIKKRVGIALNAVEGGDATAALRGLAILKNLKFKDDVELIKKCWISHIEADVNFIKRAESMLHAPVASLNSQLKLIEELSALKVNKDYSVRKLRDLLLEERL